jgi:phosphoribosylformimino-5-aminoimidazole carboxamide ribotide isomerase
VQLVGGSYQHEKVRLADPVGVALSWRRHGFRELHLIDLDAATGRGSNAELVRQIVELDDISVQVGGGIRTADQIQVALHAGASRVIVGTRAIEDQEWLAEIASSFPNAIMVAADVRERRLVTHGWARTTTRLLLDAIEDLNALPLAGILVTAVHREGQLEGTDLPLMEDVAEAADFPVYAAGGISTMNDLRALSDRGISAAIIGMALYTGALDPSRVAEEFTG